jgi:poly(A) polymerase
MKAHALATSIVKKLQGAGHTAYFAGGWVRDYLMRHPSDDIDIATSASVEEMQALFPKTVPVGIAFGILIVVEEGHPFEVATFRKESGYLDGRRPTSIERASPQEDAKRRDFTINGMFWDPIQEKLYDFVDGQGDIGKKVIRAIGDPHERFLEDRLRMMRAVRYATRFNFTIEPDTYQAILSHARSLLPAVAMERVWQEFKKMSQFAHFDRSLALLHRLQLLPTIFPALKEVSQEEIERRLLPLKQFPKEAPAFAELIELFPNPSLDDLLELCDTLKLSRAERDAARSLHRAGEILHMPSSWQKNLEPIEWAHFYADPHSKLNIQIFAAHLPFDQHLNFIEDHSQRRKTLERFIERIATQKPAVRADHLLKEGIPPGKKMGQLLKEAERISVNQQIDEPQSIIELLKNSPVWDT